MIKDNRQNAIIDMILKAKDYLTYIHKINNSDKRMQK